MMDAARKKYPGIDFRTGDAEHFSPEPQVDAVFSNAALHGVKRPDRVIRCVWDALKPGDRFVAEFGGKGNVQMIVNAAIGIFRKMGIKNPDARIPWYYPSVGEYTFLMERYGFRVAAAFHFDRPTPLLGKEGLRNWLKMFGDPMFQDLDDETKEEIILDIEALLKEKMFKNGQWMADYKRIRVVGLKE